MRTRVGGRSVLGPPALALGLLCPALFAASASAEVVIDWVLVGNPGNAPTSSATCVQESRQSTNCASVTYPYLIAKFEVTNAQYAEFLNAKAASDPLALYNTNMGSRARGGITRSGSDGSYTYAVKPGFENKPVNYVSFYDSLRFTNWLNNGQGSADTETGAYTITEVGITSNDITRNPEAAIFLPSENEWIKAAVYDPLSGSFSFLAKMCAPPSATPNTANCDDAFRDARLNSQTSEVGAYTGSASPYGTFDQIGNVWEWSDQIGEAQQPGKRIILGGAYNTFTPPDVFGGWIDAVFTESDNIGFRVAGLVPEPDTTLLGLTSLACLAALGRLRALPR